MVSEDCSYSSTRISYLKQHMAKVHGVVDPKKSLKDEANMQPSSDTICDIMDRDVKPDISASPDNLNGDIKLEIKPDPDHLPKEIIPGAIASTLPSFKVKVPQEKLKQLERVH